MSDRKHIYLITTYHVVTVLGGELTPEQQCRLQENVQHAAEQHASAGGVRAGIKLEGSEVDILEVGDSFTTFTEVPRS